MHNFIFQNSFKVLGMFTALCFLHFPLSADIIIKDAWIRPSTGPNAALYMTLTNTAPTPEKLTDARLEGCHHAELHTHEEANEISRMIQVETIEVPGLGEKELKPGGHHVMLMKLHAPLKEGDVVPVRLTFETGKTIEFIAPVKMEKADGEKSDCCGVSILQRE